MSFANVNIGSIPDDGTGDPLRTAFGKINQNFANIAAGQITVAAPVMSVAGRTGNVVLTINDIVGGTGFNIDGGSSTTVFFGADTTIDGGNA